MAETRYTKEQLVKSKKYKHEVDLLNVLLKEGETYTTKEVDKLIEAFLRKVVN